MARHSPLTWSQYVSAGRELKRLRQAVSRSCEYVAERIGTARQTVWRAENPKPGKTVGYAIIVALCDFYHIPLEDVINPGFAAYVIRCQRDSSLDRPSRGLLQGMWDEHSEIIRGVKSAYYDFPLDVVLEKGNFSKPAQQACMRRLGRGASTDREAHHWGEEIIYVLRGSIRIHFDLDDGSKKSEVLNEGDTVHFRAMTHHWVDNHSDAEAELLLIHHPPLSPEIGPPR